MSNISKVKSQLQEKEELVAALTEKLELAAEQLDRLHRTGADRGVRSGGGFPPELIERQETLVDDLQRAVQQWDDMQASALMGQLNIQVTELRDLIVSEVINGSVGRVPKILNGADSEQHVTLAVDQGSPAVLGDKASDQPSHWEAMKAELLGADSESTDSENNSVESASDVAAPEESDNANPPPTAEQTNEQVVPPTPVDFETADTETLQDSIDVRDEYIAYLIKKLRIADSQTRLPTDWAEIKDMPTDLCRQVEELQRQLDESLRLSVVERSVELARLGREDSRLKQLDESLGKIIRDKGLDSIAADSDGDNDEQPSGSSTRWLRMLGINRNTDEKE